MSNNSSNVTYKGVGFIGLLQLAFIVLKLCNVIKWSWGVVLIPLWIDLGILALVLLFYLAVYLIIRRH